MGAVKKVLEKAADVVLGKGRRTEKQIADDLKKLRGGAR